MTDTVAGPSPRPVRPLGTAPPPTLGAERVSQAVRLLQVYVFTLLVIPSDIVIKVIGAAAFPGGLIAMFAFLWWTVSSLFGQHDPRLTPNPARLSIAALWIATLCSYVVMAEALPDKLGVNAGDRWVMQLVGWTGIILVAGDCVNSMRDFWAVLRALSWGGAICGTVAAIQFWLTVDLSTYLRWVPGFTLNTENDAISGRYALNRVAGTAIHPIELGVVAATILPLAIVAALYDDSPKRTWSWVRVGLIAVAIPVSVSRSAILAAVITMGLLLACLVPRKRVIALAALPAALAAVFMAAPGLIGTMKDFFFAGSSDSSISAREHDVPLVEHLTRQAPWFGRGGGTYLPTTQIDILDNQYYRMFIELGVVGTVLVTFGYLIAPPLFAFGARKRCTSEGSRALGAALGGAAAVSVVASFTFDSMGFPMYAGIQALLVGLIGAYWRLGRQEEGAAAVGAATATPHPTHPTAPPRVIPDGSRYDARRAR
jgi:hypothetical protein